MPELSELLQQGADEARRLGVGFQLGYAELVEQDGRAAHFNSSILVGPDGQTIGHFRKIHLPGYAQPQHGHPFQNLEKRYFDVGDLGFRAWQAFGGIVGMCICNDRRWSETYRVLALQGAELILLGYNTPLLNPDFVKLAEAYGLSGMAVTKRAGVVPGVEAAREHAGAVILEFKVEQEDSVFPMVPAGADLDKMIRRPSPIVETAAD